MPLAEAAYVNPQFFYETVAPLLSLGNASFIAISTLTSDLNFYTKLISKIDPLTNEPVFKSIQIQLACQKCIDEVCLLLRKMLKRFCRVTQRLMQEKSSQCMHMQHLIPRWHSDEKHRRLKTIMSDRPDLIDSEMGGMAFSSIDQCFRASDLTRMFNESVPMTIKLGVQVRVCRSIHLHEIFVTAACVCHHTFSYDRGLSGCFGQVWVTIDPCAGGEHSDFALVSFVYISGAYQVFYV